MGVTRMATGVPPPGCGDHAVVRLPGRPHPVALPDIGQAWTEAR